jgi:hypothetical protein
MFPPEQFPAFLRDHVTPFMPTGWFASAARSVQGGNVTAAWMPAALELAVFGVLTAVLATVLFRRRLQRGESA